MEKLNKNNTRLVVQAKIYASIPGESELHIIKEEVVSAPGYLIKMPSLALYKENVEISFSLEPVAIERYKKSSQSKNMIELEERIMFEDSPTAVEGLATKTDKQTEV